MSDKIWDLLTLLCIIWTSFDLGRNWDHNIKAIKIRLRARRAYKTGATA